MSSWQSGVLLTLTTILAVAVGVLPFAQLVLLVGILLIFMAFAAALFRWPSAYCLVVSNALCDQVCGCVSLSPVDPSRAYAIVKHYFTFDLFWRLIYAVFQISRCG